MKKFFFQIHEEPFTSDQILWVKSAKGSSVS